MGTVVSFGYVEGYLVGGSFCEELFFATTKTVLLGG